MAGNRCEPTLEELAGRVRSLERENRWTKLIGGALLMVLLSVFLMGGSRRRYRRVKAKEIVVMNRKVYGNQHVRIYPNRMTFVDSNGNIAARINWNGIKLPGPVEASGFEVYAKDAGGNRRRLAKLGSVATSDVGLCVSGGKSYCTVELSASRSGPARQLVMRHGPMRKTIELEAVSPGSALSALTVQSKGSETVLYPGKLIMRDKTLQSIVSFSPARLSWKSKVMRARLLMFPDVFTMTSGRRKKTFAP
jgi:hypothetical protein